MLSYTEWMAIALDGDLSCVDSRTYFHTLLFKAILATQHQRKALIDIIVDIIAAMGRTAGHISLINVTGCDIVPDRWRGHYDRAQLLWKQGRSLLLLELRRRWFKDWVCATIASCYTEEAVHLIVDELGWLLVEQVVELARGLALSCAGVQTVLHFGVGQAQRRWLLIRLSTDFAPWGVLLRDWLCGFLLTAFFWTGSHISFFIQFFVF